SLFSNPEALNYNDDENEKIKVFSKLNSLLLLDSDNLAQSIVVPGNIYEIIDNQNPIYFTEFYNNKGTEIKIDEHEDFIKKVNKRIAIEITPPCDFASKKKQYQSRVIGGI